MLVACSVFCWRQPAVCFFRISVVCFPVPFRCLPFRLRARRALVRLRGVLRRCPVRLVWSRRAACRAYLRGMPGSCSCLCTCVFCISRSPRVLSLTGRTTSALRRRLRPRSHGTSRRARRHRPGPFCPPDSLIRTCKNASSWRGKPYAGLRSTGLVVTRFSSASARACGSVEGIRV